MLAANRTGLKTRLRQEWIAPSKSFACSYRFGPNSQDMGLS